ncbi:coenzyme A disulfide reductase [Clostridium homopropionicum DSM 5847]|uniref:Coenzyme A disulfide reductase n=1 Tax=Clostridium homopropionicum DSM 5847 TaxID=1121318 RepID=A0A0L6ZEI6_9CLOT|nr:FAD-dependent oxidoreductase [Clostridium homopropionicum]KOA21390.1 coenzyme A disulfide reductase [Clostridium homopropionicum DSM 5847]SFG11469.1 NADPH-dependent 2,4-dienoyl-CoA reductase, sulfur reductase [Clostridium homopropionicum]
MSKKVLIVGGVAGGASAAARLRRLDENAEIILFERGDYISFANCGLPYYIGGTIQERDNLLVTTSQDMNEKFNIDVRTNSEVTKVDTDKKIVTVVSKDKGTYTENYDALILSPGAKPIKPPIPGIENEKIFSLRNMSDTDKIKEYVCKNKLNSAVVIGGGFIGIEMAENLNALGIKVTLVEAAPHILAPFDTDMVTIAEKELQDNNIQLVLNNGVKSFKENCNMLNVELGDGQNISADIVILAIGVSPDVNFIKDTKLKFGPKGHIVVNEHMETNIKDVYAVGDAVEVIDFVNGQVTAIPLAGPANKQGRIAADNVAGLKTTFKGSQGSSIIKVCEMTCAATGNNERTLQRLNIPYEVIYVFPQSHASYYPGATPITLKLIFNKEGKIFGAQAIGYEGVDKRIDDIATVIRLGGTVTDLTELELCYAPPYSSAKDPVNMAGFVAENIIAGRSEVVLPRDLDSRDRDKIILLDIRTDLEQEMGTIAGSLHIPLQQLRNRLDEVDKSKEIWVYCMIGQRGYYAERLLKQKGYNVKNVTGGFKLYMSSKFTPKKLDNNTGCCNKVENVKNPNVNNGIVKNLDACGLSCPGPLMRVKAAIDEINPGDVLNVSASDPGFYEDIKSWCKTTNNELVNLCKEKGIIKATLKKSPDQVAASCDQPIVSSSKNAQTMVVFSGDLDKAIASFIIANGAAAMGKKVTMFFTFWGINILRKAQSIPTKKSFIEKMFGMMMPQGSKKLKLSQMNMAGIGPKMIRGIMKSKNVESLEALMKSAMAGGVEIVACQMSMDLLGFKQEELIDGVKIGGVGYYLGEANDAGVNLFI